MDVFSVPYRPGLLRSMIDDFELGQFGDGFFGKISRGKATHQFYLTGDFGEVTLQVYPSAGLMLVSSKVPLGGYLKAAAERQGIDPRSVVWEYRDLATILKERTFDPIDTPSVIAELPWDLTTFNERGILIACGLDVADDSLPQREVAPPRTALEFFRDLIPWSPPPTDRIAVQDAIDQACASRDAVVLRELLKKGAPRQSAYDLSLASKAVTCMSALAAVVPPTGEQLYAIARAVPLHEFMRIYDARSQGVRAKIE